MKAEGKPFVLLGRGYLQGQLGIAAEHNIQKDRLCRIDTVFGIISCSIRFNNVNLTKLNILNDSNTIAVLMQDFLNEKYFTLVPPKRIHDEKI